MPTAKALSPIGNPDGAFISQPQSLLARVLDPPSYGFLAEGKLYVPSKREILREFSGRLNVFKDRKNWLSFFTWTMTLSLLVPLYLFLTRYLSFGTFLIGFVYSMVLMGSHGTMWLHRYSTHRAFRFSNSWIRELSRNLVLKTIPEETYVISHHVHHQFPERPGDPYNVHAGWLYCFLADVNHQSINRDLSPQDYETLRKLFRHTGVRMNDYATYMKWGTLCHPLRTVLHFALNWAFWYGTFYWIGGHALACTIFGSASVWALGVRTYNYDGHGGGKDKRSVGSDFNRDDLSVNQLWPGYVAGEWHNNHHLYPNSARCGYLPYQLDLPWIYIKTLHSLGLVSVCSDYRKDFYRDHYEPYLIGLKSGKQPKPGTNPTPAS